MAVAVAVALLLLSTMASILAQSADAADAADQQRELNAMFQRALAKAREMAVDMDADRASPAAQRQRRLNERDSSGSYKPVPTWDKDSCEVSHTIHQHHVRPSKSCRIEDAVPHSLTHHSHRTAPRQPWHMYHFDQTSWLP